MGVANYSQCTQNYTVTVCVRMESRYELVFMFLYIFSDPKLYGCFNGTLGLEEYEFRTDFDYIYISVGALVGVTVTLWVLTYVLLRCAKKHK